ncbi:MAG: hypothetical protein HYV52_00875 [Parcubacteria group bacterium]|nr:hypothetical protein [Parcubacteria group bacterium]
MTTKNKIKKEHEFYACPVVPPEADTTGVRLIGDEKDREQIKNNLYGK